MAYVAGKRYVTKIDCLVLSFMGIYVHKDPPQGEDPVYTYFWNRQKILCEWVWLSVISFVDLESYVVSNYIILLCFIAN